MSSLKKKRGVKGGAAPRLAGGIANVIFCEDFSGSKLHFFGARLDCVRGEGGEVGRRERVGRWKDSQPRF